MAKCKECNVFEATEGTKGVCKKAKIQRVVTEHSHGSESTAEIVNGWPVTDGENQACGDLE